MIILTPKQFFDTLARKMADLEPHLSSYHEEKQDFFKRIAKEEIQRDMKHGIELTSQRAELVASRIISRAEREWSYMKEEAEKPFAWREDIL